MVSEISMLFYWNYAVTLHHYVSHVIVVQMSAFFSFIHSLAGNCEYISTDLTNEQSSREQIVRRFAIVVI